MKFLKSSIALFLGNVSLAITSLLLGLITARVLEPSGKGELYFVLQVINIGAMFLSVGIAPAYQYFISKKIITETKIVSHIFSQIFLTCFLLLFLFLINQYVFNVFNFFEIKNTSLELIIICSFGVILNIINLFATSIILTKINGIPFHSLLNVIGSILNLILLALFAYYDYLDVNTAILSYFAGLLIQILPKFYKIFSKIKIKINFIYDWLSISRQLFKYAIPSFLLNLAVILVFKIDTFFVNEMLGLKALGIYSMAVAFAEITLMLPSSIGTVLFTKLPTVIESEKIHLLKKVNKILIFISLLVAFSLILLGPYLIKLLLGELYIDSILPLQILAPGLVFMASNFVLTNYFSGSGLPDISAKVYGIGLIINLISNFYLISLWGINGAALASTITYFSLTMIFWFLLYRKFKITFYDLFIPKAEDIKDFYYQILDLIIKNKSNKKPL